MWQAQTFYDGHSYEGLIWSLVREWIRIASGSRYQVLDSTCPARLVTRARRDVICGVEVPRSKIRPRLARRLSVAHSRGKLPKRRSQSSCHRRADSLRNEPRRREAAGLQCGRHAQPRCFVDSIGCSMAVWLRVFASKTVTCGFGYFFFISFAAFSAASYVPNPDFSCRSTAT